VIFIAFLNEQLKWFLDGYNGLDRTIVTVWQNCQNCSVSEPFCSQWALTVRAHPLKYEVGWRGTRVRVCCMFRTHTNRVPG